MLSTKQQFIKRMFDLFFSTIGIVILAIPMLFLLILASIDTKSFGLFKQERIGQYGKPFLIFKVKSMNQNALKSNQISSFGNILRKSKLDELPQLFNVFIGNMSFVGPRPDIKGYADKLKDSNKIIISVKPGITGPATIYFKNEETLLKTVENPQQYNDEVIWIKKISLNKAYIKNWSLINDIKFIVKTLF